MCLGFTSYCNMSLLCYPLDKGSPKKLLIDVIESFTLFIYRIHSLFLDFRKAIEFIDCLLEYMRLMSFIFSFLFWNSVHFFCLRCSKGQNKNREKWGGVVSLSDA